MKTLEIILKEIQNVKVIDDTIGYNEYVALDLSVSTIDLPEEALENSKKFEFYIENYLEKNNSKVAFGGYNEERNLYKRSSIFNDTSIEERNLHIGLDLWIKSGTAVLAALDGSIHSFKHNTALGDYGPTIILKHHIKNVTFYTLYGHLSLDSIATLEIGAVFSKGQQIATLGDASINGDYAPHLHFQIIKDIATNTGDYPGVCSKSDINFYLENCPDPNLLLKIN